MNILIAQSYFRVLDPKEYRRDMPYPPLGTLIAAKKLSKEGHTINFFDSMISKNPHDLFSTIDNLSPNLVVLYDDEFNYLTKMCLSNMRNFTQKIITYCNSLEIPVITYNSDAMDHPDQYLLHGDNYVIYGEGEITLSELVGALENNTIENEKYSIPGIKFLNGDTIITNEGRELTSDLDHLPDPDYDLVNLEKYKSIWLQKQGYFSLNISTSRGCTFSCNWCAKPLWGRVYNTYSPDRIVDLMEKMQDKYGVDHIWFTDDIFGLKSKWLERFANLCEEKKLTIPFKCLSRADLVIRENTLRNLQKAGCDTIWIGAESGSQKILDAMDKGTKVDQIYEAVDKAKKYGIKIAFFIQFGYLGENWDDIQKTRKLIKDNLPTDIGISVSYPLPGTEFYNKVKDQLQQKQNWTDSDDLAMLYEGTYPSNFYKALHRVVHAEYRVLKYMKHKQWQKLPHIMLQMVKFVFYRTKMEMLRKDRNGRGSPTHPLPVLT